MNGWGLLEDTYKYLTVTFNNLLRAVDYWPLYYSGDLIQLSVLKYRTGDV
jgi:hypothetical protein